MLNQFNQQVAFYRQLYATAQARIVELEAEVARLTELVKLLIGDSNDR